MSDANASAASEGPCPSCDPSFSCFDGGALCRKDWIPPEPAPTSEAGGEERRSPFVLHDGPFVPGPNDRCFQRDQSGRMCGQKARLHGAPQEDAATNDPRRTGSAVGWNESRARSTVEPAEPPEGSGMQWSPTGSPNIGCQEGSTPSGDLQIDDHSFDQGYQQGLNQRAEEMAADRRMNSLLRAEVERLQKQVAALQAHLRNRHKCDTTEEEPDYGP